MTTQWTAWDNHTQNNQDGSSFTYQAANCEVVPSGGAILRASCTPPDYLSWDTASLTSQGTRLTYGFIEARIKFVKCQGMNSAFFLFGATIDGNSTTQGELDFEMLDPACKKMTVSVHNDGNTYTVGYEYDSGIDLSLDWHTYGIWWTPMFARFYIDGVGVTEWNDDGAGGVIPQAPMQVYLGLTVGSTAGLPDETSPTPVAMYVDYVKIWQD